MNKTIQKGLLFGSLFFILGLLFLCKWIPSTLNMNQSIQWHHQTPYVLFYRNNCRDCHSLYSKMIQTHLIHSDSKVTFIDLAQEKNRHYIQEFGVVEVPTLFQCDRKGYPSNEWMGTKDIQIELNKLNERGTK